MKKLAEFAEHMIRASWDGCGMDGGEIQELAVECGLITETKYNPKEHGPNEYDIAPGEPYFIFSEEFNRAMKGRDND